MESCVTRARDKAAALRFLRKALRRHGCPQQPVTDRLRTYGAALKALGRGDDREMGRWTNNRAEDAHLPFRRRERAMLRFHRMRGLQKFASVHASVYNNLERVLSSRPSYKANRAAALEEWRALLAAWRSGRVGQTERPVRIRLTAPLLRIILGGVFDKVPNAKLIVGHMGEIAVYWAWRIDHRIRREGWDEWERQNGKSRRLTVTEYLRRNVWITTSGVFDTAGLRHAVEVMGAERVLYSVDYPYESTVEARDWFNSLDLPADQRDMIAQGNARRILKL